MTGDAEIGATGLPPPQQASPSELAGENERCSLLNVLFFFRQGVVYFIGGRCHEGSLPLIGDFF